MAERLTPTSEALTYESRVHVDSDFWTDDEPEEIVTVAKSCAYDPLTRL
jgi:hypothetical protein